MRSATGIAVSSNGENDRLVLHVKDSISTKTVPLYVTPSDCLNTNLAGNKMLTEQPTLFCAQQKFIMLVSAQSYFTRYSKIRARGTMAICQLTLTANYSKNILTKN